MCNVNKDYGDKTIIENLNLNLNNKEIIAIMGSNGIGKTTLLNIITGLIRPDSG
ncbi:ATP-binding cassette domain-containing protein, partial [Bacillus thuringiensis]|uniref:ATP-binding cassette domain-containing protein n=2 Tax=Bacillaceae TaxID=186817 RepID=UPI003B9833ED